MSLRLVTGFEVPDDFPQQPFDSILTHVGSQRQEDSLFHYTGSWNAIAYRFMSCATSSETFTDSVRVAGTAPPLPERFKQEVALFDFFINGLAVIDSFFYGLYWIGSMVDTNKFPILSGELLRDIQVVKTVEKYMARFPSSSLITAFGRLGHGSSSKDWKNTREYKEWKTVRNILAHRAAYGRALNLGSELGDVWRVGNIQLNDQLTSSRRQWLASTLTDLMGGAEGFVRSTL